MNSPKIETEFNQRGYKFKCICGHEYIDVILTRFKCIDYKREIIIDWKQETTILQDQKSSET